MQFDEKFLQEMGLSAMPEEQKQKFLDYIQVEIHEIQHQPNRRLCFGFNIERLCLATLANGALFEKNSFKITAAKTTLDHLTLPIL